MGFYEKQGRYILMALTVLFMVGAAICIIVGIWAAIAASGLIGAILIVGGIISFGLNFLGFQGAHKKDTAKLKCYAWILVVLSVLAIISAIVNISTGNGNTSNIDPHTANFMKQMNIASFINIAIQILCIVLAFGLASEIANKSNLPPVYSNM